jgi:type VI secretion system protein VasD
VLSGCSSLPFIGGKPKANVRMTASATSNDCGKGTGAPLRFRILQLRDGSVLTGVSVADLWDKEDKLLGAAFIARSQDMVIEPGTRKSLSVELDPEARAVAVVGDFCKTQGSCWYDVRSRKGGGLGFDLVAEASCLRQRD